MKFISILTLSFLMALVSSCTRKAGPQTLTGQAMGSTWKLVWRGKKVDGLENQVSAVLEKWEAVLSQWRGNSDLTRYNHGQAATPELQRVLDLAEEVHIASHGAFDHHLLKETGDAGFGPGGSGTDLSAIGKGFAVDRVGERLRELGVTDFVFALAGEVLTGDEEWEVGIEKPDPALRVIARTVKLKHQALSTSGNYRQFKPVPGGLACHIIDPQTKKPIIRPACSVSVIAADSTTADAWATALFVLGKEAPVPPGLQVSWTDAE